MQGFKTSHQSHNSVMRVGFLMRFDIDGKRGKLRTSGIIGNLYRMTKSEGKRGNICVTTLGMLSECDTNGFVEK